MIMRGNNDDGGDLILHLLLGDFYLPYLELRNFGEYLGCSFNFFGTFVLFLILSFFSLLSLEQPSLLMEPYQ